MAAPRRRDPGDGVCLVRRRFGPLRARGDHVDVVRATHLLAGVSTFVIGGEALDWGLVELCRAQAPQARIFNEYGPTETVVGCSVHELCGPARPGPVPIGRPIANTQMYILDAQLQPVPIGVTGQIYIGGFGLARGYWKRPELTRDKFITNPHAREPGARLYKTGDLGRFLPDGTIEFLGRIDHQVKLRGYRIELGEIEAVLATHPEIADCTVIAHKDAPADERLIAYVAPRPGRQPTVASLRNHLSTKLPSYMLPEGFVFLAALPQTVNGKLDRAALPAASPERQQESFAPPQTPAEQILADIISGLLHIDRVGRYDNFFSLGGHSLLATQAVSRIRADLPGDLKDPVISKVNLSGSPILTYTVASTRMDEESLSWFVDQQVAKTVLAVRGVGAVARVGGVTREVRVELDPARLLALNATAADISRQLRQVQQEASGGRADLGGAEQSVRTIATVQSAEELAAMEVALSDGRRIRLDQVAKVHDTIAEPRSAALLNGKPVVGFEISRSRGAGEVEVAESPCEGGQQSSAGIAVDGGQCPADLVEGRRTWLLVLGHDDQYGARGRIST